MAFIKHESVVSQGEPRDTAVSVDTYRILQ